MEAAVPIAGDDVHEDDAYVSGGVLADSPELPRVEEVVGDSIELKAFGEDFSEELTQSVEESDGAEGFGQVIPVLLGFRDDDGIRRFQLSNRKHIAPSLPLDDQRQREVAQAIPSLSTSHVKKDTSLRSDYERLIPSPLPTYVLL